MRQMWALAAVLVCAHSALGDTLVLKNGTSIEWRIIKDNGDTLEVQTVDNQTITIAKKDIKEIRSSIPKAPLTGATFTGDITKAASSPVNVLSAIDLKKAGATSEWRTGSGKLTGATTTADTPIWLELPHIPVDQYDVEVVAERKDGDGELVIGLVGGGRQFGVSLDCLKGTVSGLRTVDAKLPHANETGVNGRIFTDKQPRTIICSVRKDRVVVTVQAKALINWKADYGRVGLDGGRASRNPSLFLSICNGSFSISRLVVTPRTDAEPK